MDRRPRREGAGDAWFETFNPGTGQSICRVARAGDADLDHAVAAARRASGEWKRMSGVARGRVLRALADMAQQHSRGIPLDKVFASQRPPVWDKRKPLLRAALQRHPAMAWERWLGDAQTVDEQIKGQAPGSPWDGLARILVEASGARLAL